MNKIELTQQDFIEYLEMVNWEGSKLPNGIIINGILDLDHSKVKSLPDNLTIKETLFLNNTTNIANLPSNLRICNWSLYLFNSKISRLPSDLFVKRIIYICRNQLKNIPKKFKYKIAIV